MLVLLALILVPFAAAAAVLVIDSKHAHSIALAASAITFALTLISIAASYEYGIGSLSLSFGYIPQLNLDFSLYATAPTLVLMLMASIVFLAASIVGKYFMGERQRIYNFIFLIAEASSLGVFAASNLFILYIFWELAEVVMFFIIFMYGGYNRRYAGIKFIIYSAISSLLLLIGIMLLYSSTVPHTFSISAIIASSASISARTQLLVMLLFIVSFMIKMPVFPLHTWLPDAHTEAPTTGSMILAGVLLKFGGYLLLLTYLMLPIASHYAPYLLLIFLFSAIYSGIVCLVQSNVKRLIAYTSIVDMGIVGVGLSALNSVGTTGAVYFMLSHGLAISLLFLVAGTLDELYGTLEISKIKGVIKNFAGLSYLFIIGVFGAIGLPLTAAFIADILVFIGAAIAFGVTGIVPLAGIFLMGAALFWVIERMFINSSEATEPYRTLSTDVMVSGMLLLCSSIALGLLPFLVLSL